MTRPLLDNWHELGPLLIWVGRRRPFVRTHWRVGMMGRVFYYACMVPFLWAVLVSLLVRLLELGPSPDRAVGIFVLVVAFGVSIILARRLERVLRP